MMRAKVDAAAGVFGVLTKGTAEELLEDVNWLVWYLHKRISEKDEEDARVFRENLYDKLADEEFWARTSDAWKVPGGYV